MRKKPCVIKAEVKNRNGKPRYWCWTHGERAWLKGGEPAKACRSTDRNLPEPDDILRVAAADYPGGIGVWGAVLPLYDSTLFPPTSGVHVHARLVPGGPKQLDETRAELAVESDTGVTVPISEAAARAYVATVILCGHPVELHCPRCGFLHIDQGEFAVNPHRKHQCNRCGRSFYEKGLSIGNPVAAAQRLLGVRTDLEQVQSDKTVELSDLAQAATGGIQVWASNPAILWTVPREEQAGIHIHAYENGQITPLIDETFGVVTLYGTVINDRAVRLLMAQSKLGYLRNRIAKEICPHCQRPHFDDALPWSVKPHREHLCESCGNAFVVPRRTVSNPEYDLEKKLEPLFPKLAPPSEASPDRPGLRGATFRRVPPPAQPDPSESPRLCKKSQHLP
jgi:transposase-like protein